MQSGPAGVQGSKGDTGATGTNGNSILSGTINPSNLANGSEGDFYLNTNSYVLFGPKVNGNWGTGIPLIQSLAPPVVTDFPAGTDTPLLLTNYQTYYQDYGNYPTLILQEVTDASTIRERTDIQPSKFFINKLLDGISIDVPADSDGKSLVHLQRIIKP